jgi:hypothetical protein
VIETEYASKCETFLHNRLQARRCRQSGANEFFEIDPGTLAVEIQAARDYTNNDLPLLAQALVLADQGCEDRLVEPTDSDMSTYQRLLEVRAAHESLTHEKERLEALLKIAIGTASGMSGVATWKTVEGHRLDTDRLAQERPDIYHDFSRETRIRTLRLL